MSFANPPDPIGANASFTSLSEPFNTLNLSETPNFNSSTDIILNQTHSLIPYNLDSSPGTFGFKTIVFSPGTPVPTATLVVNLASSAKELINKLFNLPYVGQIYEVLIINNISLENIKLQVDNNNVFVAPQSITKLAITPIDNNENVSLNVTAVGGLGAVPINHFGHVVTAPPTSSLRITPQELVILSNNIGPSQITFNTVATDTTADGPLPQIKDILNYITGTQANLTFTIQFIAHNKDQTLTWKTYTDNGGGAVSTSATPSANAPFAQKANTTYLISLTITPLGIAPDWTNSTMKIGCLSLAN